MSAGRARRRRLALRTIGLVLSLVATDPTLAAGGDLFDHYGFSVVPGAKRAVPCRPPEFPTGYLDRTLVTCIDPVDGSMAGELQVQDALGAELFRRGWRLCIGLGNIFVFLNDRHPGIALSMVGVPLDVPGRDGAGRKATRYVFAAENKPGVRLTDCPKPR